jgi:hypothetical protein
MTISKLEEQLLGIEEYIQKLKEEDRIKESKEYEERLRKLGKYDGPKTYTILIYSGWWPFGGH